MNNVFRWVMLWFISGCKSSSCNYIITQEEIELQFDIGGEG